MSITMNNVRAVWHEFKSSFRSIRTRYSFATAAFLILILLMFYTGGRIVLVHLVRDTEQQIQSVTHSVNRYVQQDAQRLQAAARTIAASLAAGGTFATTELIGPCAGVNIELALRLDAQGAFQTGHRRAPKKAVVEPVAAGDLKAYRATFANWAHVAPGSNLVIKTGILNLKGRVYQSAVIRERAQFLVVGTPFSVNHFTTQLNESLGQTLRLTATMTPTLSIRPPAAAPQRPTSYGLIPMISEAMNFYSGGFWNFEENPLGATFMLRDLAGHSVAQISVAMPKSFATVTSSALNRLTCSIAIIGLLFVLPIFWMQCQVLLNPLSDMARRIQEVGERHTDEDCPRLDWKGEDEFAHLAASVNRLLETISRRTVDIRQAARRQQAFIDGMPDGLVIFDSLCRFVTLVKQPEEVAAIPGLVPKKPLDISVWGETNTHRFAEAVSRAFADRRRHGVRLVLGDRAYAGTRRDFDVRIIPMDDHFALVVVRDVTFEALAEHRRLVEMERDSHYRKQESLAAFAAGIAHDVRNILGIVLNTAEMSWRKEQSNVNREVLATLRAAVHRGTDMMRELMAFADETAMTLVPTAPAALINGADPLLQAIVTPRIQLAFDVPTDLPEVDADPTRMWKAFFNLIKNAAEAIGDTPGLIRVAALPFTMREDEAEAFSSSKPLQPGPGVLFSVTDNGPGIPDDVINRILDPYVTTRGSGRGLGLSIAYATVNAHGGGLRIHSAVGYGTSFEIFLPASHSHGAAAAEATPTEQPQTGLSAIRNAILVIDDEPAVLNTTSTLLRFLRLTAICADDRHTALLKFRRHAPSLGCVLLDAHLQSINTARIARIMRRIAPNVPIILTSGSSEKELAPFFEPELYNAFLSKPYTLDEFKAALAEI